MTLEDVARIAAPTLQALSIAVTAGFAISGLNAWRRQLVGRRRIEIAEETLLAAYKVRDAFPYFRSPGHPFAGEGSTRPGRGDNEPAGLASMRDSYYVPIERLQDPRLVDAFAQFSKAAVLCETYFGTTTANPFHEILRARNRVVVAAQMLLRTSGDNVVDQNRRSSWEAEIWARTREPDDIAESVERSIQEIEAMCRPLLVVGSDRTVARRPENRMNQRTFRQLVIGGALVVVAFAGGTLSIPGGAKIETPGLLKQLSKAREVRGQNPKVDEATISSLPSRVKRVPAGRVLWVDDALLNNQNERLALAELGVFVDAYTNNADALAAFQRSQYDLVISDIDRPAGQESGLTLLNSVRKLRPDVPFLFYVNKVEGAGVPGAQGITNDPVELVILVQRSLKQRKG